MLEPRTNYLQLVVLDVWQKLWIPCFPWKWKKPHPQTCVVLSASVTSLQHSHPGTLSHSLGSAGIGSSGMAITMWWVWKLSSGFPRYMSVNNVPLSPAPRCQSWEMVFQDAVRGQGSETCLQGQVEHVEIHCWWSSGPWAISWISAVHSPLDSVRGRTVLTWISGTGDRGRCLSEQ